ncbi:hypothetical protein CLMAG_57120 [Clostridium magnum DSM 2767]|uniref:Methyl-accepting chemotaxis protein n=1 Tax=Clostridium magnum DSM 2767 TaxID=1121326 RepID=A0A162QVA0_9CLOT|nr:hypothetical protein CLMAG_57120 [Clostridium magnum DSM 2767]SHI23282.1 methyl-accepting chemotaxis protein [Clostridium magnum DSM 2767]
MLISEVMVTQSSSITQNSEKVARDAEKLSSTSDEISKQIQMFKI